MLCGFREGYIDHWQSHDHQESGSILTASEARLQSITPANSLAEVTALSTTESISNLRCQQDA